MEKCSLRSSETHTHTVAVVLRELVVKVVISFAHRNKGCDKAVARRVAVRVCGSAGVVSERVDAKGRVVYKDETKHARDEVAAPKVAPQQAADERRQDKAHEENAERIVLVLPHDDPIRFEVCIGGNSVPRRRAL